MATATENKGKSKKGKKRTKVSAAAEKENSKDEKVKAKASGEEGKQTHAEVVVEHEDRKKEAKLRQRTVRDLRDKETELWMEMAEQLYEIQEKKLYHHMLNPQTGAKYTSFQEFAQTELPYSDRKATYLIEIWRKCVIEHSREFLDSIKHLGVSTIKEVSGFLNPDNKVEVLAEIEGSPDKPSMSVRDVRNFVRESKARNKKKSKKKGKTKSDPGDSKTGKDAKQEHPKKVRFAMFEAQRDNLQMAIDTAKKVRGTESDAEALEIIALDFQSHHVDPSEESKVGIVRNVESALESKVLLLNSKGDIGYFSKGKLASTKEGRVKELFELLEIELDCQLAAFKDNAILYSGVEEEPDDSIQSFLVRVEWLLGVQLLAVMDSEEGPVSVYANPVLEQHFVEE